MKFDNLSLASEMNNPKLLNYLERKAVSIIDQHVPAGSNVTNECAGRIAFGQEAYGALYPGKHDWIAEIKEELRDQINYAAFAYVDESSAADRDMLLDIIEQAGSLLVLLDNKTKGKQPFVHHESWMDYDTEPSSHDKPTSTSLCPGDK